MGCPANSWVQSFLDAYNLGQGVIPSHVRPSLPLDLYLYWIPSNTVLMIIKGLWGRAVLILIKVPLDK